MTERSPASSALTLWLEVSSNLRFSADTTEGQWSVFVEEYNRTSRVFHSAARLERLAQLVLDYKQQFLEPLSVSIAIFYSELFADPTREDNQVRASKAWRNFARIWSDHIDQTLADRVCFLVESSRPLLFNQGALCATDSDLQLFLDILHEHTGVNREAYTKFSKQIELEFPHLNRAQYVLFRTKVVKIMLQGPVFRTPSFRGRYELRAKANLQHELDMLSRPPLKLVRLTISDVAAVEAFEGKHRPDRALRLSSEQMKHALALGMELCYASRSSTTQEIMCCVVGTLTPDEQYSTGARTAHDFSGHHLLIHIAVTHEDYRNEGYMTSMLREYLHHIRSAKPYVRRISLICPLKVTSFFERFGFQVVRYGILRDPCSTIEPCAPPSDGATSPADTVLDAETFHGPSVSEGPLGFSNENDPMSQSTTSTVEGMRDTSNSLAPTPVSAPLRLMTPKSYVAPPAAAVETGFGPLGLMLLPPGTAQSSTGKRTPKSRGRSPSKEALPVHVAEMTLEAKLIRNL